MSATTAPRTGSGAVALRRLLLVLTGALLVAAIYGALFAVDVTAYGVVSRFGHRAGGGHPGPARQTAVRAGAARRPSAALFQAGAGRISHLRQEERGGAQPLALWRIADPERFLETVRNRAGAELQLADVVHAEVGAALGKYPFASFVSAAGGQSQFVTLVEEVHNAVQVHALPAFGIDVVELDVRQLYLPEANRQSVFERMKAERGKIAKQFRSEGERDAKRLIAEAERDKTRITAEAYAEAARTKAEGEAEAMGIYADALERNSAFYKFLRTLQAYEKLLDDKTTLFLPADAEILAILRENGAAPDAPATGPKRRLPKAALRRTGRGEQPRLEASDDHRQPATGVPNGWRRVRGRGSSLAWPRAPGAARGLCRHGVLRRQHR